MQNPQDRPATVPELLQQILDRTGLPQAGLARLASTDAAQVNRWMRGRQNPSVPSIRQLIAGLATDYPELIELASHLFDAAGHGQTIPPDTRPQIVRDNWDDADIKKIWSLRVSEEQRLAMVVAVLEERSGAGSSRA